MEVLFTICGRAGSKGIKNKNIRDFLGAPLPFYSLATIELYLKKNPHISADIALNTDSEELKKLFSKQGLPQINIINRSENLATDNAPKIAVILDCLQNSEKNQHKNYDLVVDLDITSPLRTVMDLENLINRYVDTKCDVVFSVTTSRRNPYFNMVKKTESGYKRVLESNYNTRQEAPEIFDMNASLYGYSPDYLRMQKGVLDGYCEAIFMYDTAVLDLDHENDFELMEVIANHLFSTKSEFNKIQEAALMY